MKKFIYIGVLIMIVSLFTGCFKRKVRIDNLKSFHYSYSTGWHANASESFEIELDEDGKYIVKVKDDGMEQEDARKYVVDKSDIRMFESLLNEINIYKWDGFDKVDKDVLDGNSFSLSINFGEDKSISAHGYMRYPSGYREKTDSIKYWFSKIDKDKPKDTV
jgi:hypothetical protein